jgi:hypothetical protein
MLHETDPEIDIESDGDADEGTPVDPVFKPPPND